MNPNEKELRVYPEFKKESELSALLIETIESTKLLRRTLREHGINQGTLSRHTEENEDFKQLYNGMSMIKNDIQKLEVKLSKKKHSVKHFFFSIYLGFFIGLLIAVLIFK